MCKPAASRLGPRTTVESLGDGRSKRGGSRLLLPLADKCRLTGSQWWLFSCMYTSVCIFAIFYVMCVCVCVCVGVECVSVCVCVLVSRLHKLIKVRGNLGACTQKLHRCVVE